MAFFWFVVENFLRNSRRFVDPFSWNYLRAVPVAAVEPEATHARHVMRRHEIYGEVAKHTEFSLGVQIEITVLP